MPDFEITEVEQLFSGHVFRIERLHVSLGAERFDREVLRHPGAVAVVAFDANENVVLIEQYRASLDRTELEIPAGTRDVSGEDLATTAARELREEVGYQADDLVLLGSFLNAPGYSDQRTAVFLGRNVTEVGRLPEGPEERAAQVRLIPFDEALAMVESGEIDEVGTVYGLLRAARHNGRS